MLWFRRKSFLGFLLLLFLIIRGTVLFAQDSGWDRDQCIRCEEIWDLAWSPDSKLLAVAASDGLSLYDVSGKIVARLTDGELALNVAWSYDGSLIASFQGNVFDPDQAHLRIFDVQARRVLRRELPTESSSANFSWNPHENILAYANNLVLNLWDARTDKIEIAAGLQFPDRPIDPNHYGTVQNVAWNPMGDSIAISTVYDQVLIWNTQTHQIDATFDIRLFPYDHMAWRPDGQELIVTKLGGGAKLLDIQSRHVTDVDPPSPSLAAWDPTGRFVAVALLGHFIDAPPQILDSKTWQPIQYLDWRDGWSVVKALAWSSDGHHIALGMDDGYVETWNHPD